jgi:biotin carboxyl carrier protein
MTQLREPLVSETALTDLPDRIVVSPAHGRVVVPLPKSFGTEGEVVRAGDVIAVVNATSQSVEVRSPCDAWVLTFLARDGDRVRPGAPIAHLRQI